MRRSAAVLIATALTASPVIAQTAQPDLQPITLDAKQLAPLLQLLGSLPYNNVANVLEPIIVLEINAQRAAQAKAAEPPAPAPVAKPTPSPTPTPTPVPTPGVTDSGANSK